MEDGFGESADRGGDLIRSSQENESRHWLAVTSNGVGLHGLIPGMVVVGFTSRLFNFKLFLAGLSRVLALHSERSICNRISMLALVHTSVRLPRYDGIRSVVL